MIYCSKKTPVDEHIYNSHASNNLFHRIVLDFLDFEVSKNRIPTNRKYGDGC